MSCRTGQLDKILVIKVKLTTKRAFPPETMRPAAAPFLKLFEDVSDKSGSTRPEGKNLPKKPKDRS